MLILLAILPDAAAFRISAHRAITQEAVQAEGLEAVGRWLWQGNRAEDTRLNVKWRHFSHYFRPDASLTLPRRDTSDARVAMLLVEAEAAEAAGDEAAMWQAIGGIIHHVQDMASPPHVVPIAHDLRDGFESTPVDGLMADLALLTPETLDPVAAHSALAWETWERVQKDAVTGCGATIPLSDIWQAPDSGAFGTYGGMDFGETGDCPELSRAYEGVLVDRLEAAVRYSRSVLQHFAP
ncbi:MAG: hypothetical protein ACI8RZ_001852 [Myxococcota bacterium]|jgi:hypothetical protein